MLCEIYNCKHIRIFFVFYNSFKFNLWCRDPKKMSEGGFCIVDKIPSDTKTNGGTVDFNKLDKYRSPKLIFTGYKLVCATTKSYVLKKLFDVWGSFATTTAVAAIIFKTDGIHISEADSDQKLFMMTHLKSDDFLGYHCPENFYMKINMKNLVEKFSKVRKVKHLSKITVSTVDKLNVCLLDDESAKEVERVVLAEPLVESTTSTTHVEIGLNAEFSFKCKMEIEKLSEIRAEFGNVKKITISINDESLTFSSDFITIILPHPTTSSADRKSIEPVKINVENAYLKKVIKMMDKIKLHPGGKFDMYFSPKYSFIKFVQDVGGIGENTYVLASAS